MAVSSTIKLGEHVYSPLVRRGIQFAQAVGVVVLLAILVGLLVMPALALRVLWYACIPLAPMVLLVAPNFWVSVCPVSTLQVVPNRIRKRQRRQLSPELSRRLQLFGWAAMFLGIPTRHLALNFQAQWLFGILVLMAAVVLTVGITTKGLSGWCVGACPIRPIEMVYGQFALDTRRPEKCTDCGGCTAHCSRIKPRTSGGELEREPLARWLCYGLPGFIVAYFALDFTGVWRAEDNFFLRGLGATPVTLAAVGTVYAWIATGFIVSAGIAWLLERAVTNRTSLLRGLAITSYCCYYTGVVPEIVKVWRMDPVWVPVLGLVPATVLLVALAGQRRAATAA